MEALIRSIGREPMQRDTLYGLCLPDYRGRLDIDDDRALDIDKYPNR